MTVGEMMQLQQTVEEAVDVLMIVSPRPADERA
jgi:hypothetical protein